jgi:hypothetical protein
LVSAATALGLLEVCDTTSSMSFFSRPDASASPSGLVARPTLDSFAERAPKAYAVRGSRRLVVSLASVRAPLQRQRPAFVPHRPRSDCSCGRAPLLPIFVCEGGTYVHCSPPT